MSTFYRLRLVFLTLSSFLLGHIGAQDSIAVPKAASDAEGYERSLAVVRSVLARRPNDAMVLHILGEVHFRRGKFTDAVHAYEEGLKADPQSVECNLGLAEAFHQLDRFEEAAAAYRKVIKAGPSTPAAQARRDFGRLLYDKGLHREAAEQFRDGIRAGDASADMHFLLGRAIEAQARGLRAGPRTQEEKARVERVEAEAVSALELALQADPGHAQAHFVLASIHRRQGKQELARQEMEKFQRLKRAPDALNAAELKKVDSKAEALTAVRLARVLFQGGDASGAWGLTLHALSLHPDLDEALAYKAWILLKSQKVEEARQVYEMILTRKPNHAEALWNLGKIHVSLNQMDQAGPLLLRALEADRLIPQGWELLTKMALENGLYAERAEEFARNALRMRNDGSNFARLALVLYGSGKLVECQKTLAEGLKRFPADPDLQQAWQALQQGGGK